jgi:hypothetical protein
MKEEIKEAELQKFNRYGKIFTPLLLLTIISCVPLAIFLNYFGLITWAIITAITMYYAIKIEKCKKENNVQTYKEIVAFTEGKRLDEIEKNQEYGKRPYQKLLLALGSALFTLFICLLLAWMLKPFI